MSHLTTSCPSRPSAKGTLYAASLIKKVRRTNADLANVLEWVKWVLADEGEVMSIRHLFYRLVGHNAIAKTEKDYARLVQRLAYWRRSGDVPWSAFTDSTRWHISETTFDSVNDALTDCVTTYRRNLWREQSCYLECYCEKDACAGIIAKVAGPFGVPVFVARGFASLSSLYSAAETFKAAIAKGKRCIIYHFGDYDPSGVKAGESMVNAFRDDFKVKVEFHRAAVTQEQIKRLKLPTRPTKASTHSKGWTGGESVELDTMPIKEVHALVERCITKHIDQRTWEQAKLTEKLERETLNQYQEGFRRGGQ